MRKAITLMALGVALSAAATPAIPRDNDMELEIAQRLKTMTLEEKVGQMCELVIDVLGQFDPGVNPTMEMNRAHLDDMLTRWKIGSFLNVPGIALAPEQMYSLVAPIQEASMRILGIPTIYGLDMNHGASYALGATLFPQNINMGATFNRDLCRQGGEVTAYETRACDVPWTYNPTVDLSRNPLWPRMWENYGEDAYLSAQLCAATVRGMQGDDPNRIDRFHIASNIKHFMGYGAPVSGKDRTHSAISDQEMREKHFAPYLAGIVDSHALSVMVNSTTNFGIPFHANAKYLTRWLKEELDWDGLIVTDWADINNLYSRDYVARDKKDAIRMAINAGIDMAMEPYNTDFCTLLKELVEEGKVSMSRIDDAVSRVLRMKMRLGLFRTPDTCWKDYPLFGSHEFAAKSRRAAVESMVLLKNDGGVLPLRSGSRILVTGPNANSMRCLNGGWTYTWQGHLTDSLAVSRRYNTVLEALRKRFGADNIVYEPGILYERDAQWEGNWGKEIVGDFDAVTRAADDVDVIVAVIGETSYCETPGNIDDLTLSPNQTALVERLYATGKPVVLVLNEGRPRIINPLVDRAKAIVDIMLPSNYGGDALAALLVGDENFSGRLPFTYPKHTGALTTYDYKKGEVVGTMEGAYNYEARVDVQWPFGFGLSYTSFTYSNLRASKTRFTADDTLTFSVDVTNCGGREGMETVMLFSSDLVATTSPDIMRLRQFDKISLKPGETRTVSLSIPASDLAYVGYDDRWILEEGEFLMRMGTETLLIEATATHVWDSPNK